MRKLAKCGSGDAQTRGGTRKLTDRRAGYALGGGGAQTD
jgi:hypothetical protein